jgi:hypothetical protein
VILIAGIVMKIRDFESTHIAAKDDEKVDEESWHD